MMEFFCRCSSLGTLMTDPRSIDPALLDEETAAIVAKRSKTPEDHARLAPLFDMSLSAGAKTMLDQIAHEHVYEYEYRFSSKYTTKGKIVEDESIELYNKRFGTFYVKNKERRFNGYIQGECDIDTGEEIIDIKSSWSLKTFPATAEDAHDPNYEWQVRGYMMLWERERATVAFCLIDTPEELIGHEDPELHAISYRIVKEGEEKRAPVALELRVTTVSYTRDRTLEERIIRRVTAARAYLIERIKRIFEQHPQLEEGI